MKTGDIARTLGLEIIGNPDQPIHSAAAMESATPEQVAAAILTGLENGDEEIFPDPMSVQVHAELLHSPKQVEREFATTIPACEALGEFF